MITKTGIKIEGKGINPYDVEVDGVVDTITLNNLYPNTTYTATPYYIVDDFEKYFGKELVFTTLPKNLRYIIHDMVTDGMAFESVVEIGTEIESAFSFDDTDLFIILNVGGLDSYDNVELLTIGNDIYGEESVHIMTNDENTIYVSDSAYTKSESSDTYYLYMTKTALYVRDDYSDWQLLIEGEKVNNITDNGNTLHIGCGENISVGCKIDVYYEK